MAGFTQFKTSDRVLNTRMNAFGNELFSQITKYSTYDLYLKQGNLMNPQKPTGAGTEVTFANVTNVEKLAYTFNYAIPEDLIISKDNRYNLVIPFKQLGTNRSFVFRFLYKHEGTTIFNITRNAVTTATGNLTVEFQALNQNVVDITALANTTATLQIFVKTLTGTDAQISLLVNDVNALGRLSRNEATAIVSADNVLMPDGTTSVSSAIGQNTHDIAQISNPNLLINGDFQIWQRGTSFDVINGSVAFSVDRWLVVNTLGLTGSVRTRKLTAINGGESLVLENLGSGSGSAIISQGLEELDVNKLRGKRVTLSYFFNTKMSDIGVVTYARFSETQAIQANGVGANVFLKNDTGSTTWKKVTQTFDVPANAKGLAIGIYPQFLANRIGDFLQIRDVKLELGEIATPLSPRPYGEELALCQRYYQTRSVNTISDVDLRPSMRISPTKTVITGGYSYDAEIY